MEDEANPETARQNAEVNFQKLITQIPRSIQAREEKLLEEIASVQGSALKKLRILHQATEELSKAISPFIACRRGCNACCH